VVFKVTGIWNSEAKRAAAADPVMLPFRRDVASAYGRSNRRYGRILRRHATKTYTHYS
jgi:hypothetical protein